mgnify:CR=1 FL=1
MASNCPKKKQLTVRATTSQLELTELEEGSEQDIQAIAAQYEEEDEEGIVVAVAAIAMESLSYLISTIFS